MENEETCREIVANIKDIEHLFEFYIDILNLAFEKLRQNDAKKFISFFDIDNYTRLKFEYKELARKFKFEDKYIEEIINKIETSHWK